MTCRCPNRFVLMAVAMAASVTVFAQVATDPSKAPQTPAVPAAPLSGDQTPLAKHYTGAPMDVDLEGADLRVVLRSFADANSLNMVIDSAVKGTVTIKLTKVPWDQALEVILKSNNLGTVVDGTIVRIVPLAVLKEEASDRERLVDAEAPSARKLRSFPLSYAEAVKIEPLVKTTVLSKFGDTKVDERTNTLIVRDLPENLDQVAALMLLLDQAQPQVEIEARIVETDRDSAKSLGVQWGVNGQLSPQLGNTTSLAFPNQGSLSGQVTNDSGAVQTTGGSASAVNLPAQAPGQLASSALGLAMGAINGAFNLDVALSALEHRGKVHILSTPHVTTQNNTQAEVTQGTTIPYQTVSNNTTSVSFRDAALKLTVIPHITASGTVVMDVQLENGFPDFAHTVNGNPTITTQRATTKVLVSDGVTTVIGGIVVNTDTSGTDRTPGLSQIPLLGWLFRRDTNTSDNKELLIFITPRIIRSRP